MHLRSVGTTSKGSQFPKQEMDESKRPLCRWCLTAVVMTLPTEMQSTEVQLYSPDMRHPSMSTVTE
jgi:hypothetical protein